MYLCMAVMYAGAIATLASVYGLVPLAYLTLLLMGLAVGFTYSLLRSEKPYFTLFAGVAIALEDLILGATGDRGFELLWIVLGFGLLAILIGNHAIRTMELIRTTPMAPGPEEDLFYPAALRGLLRIIYFIGLVMLVSLITLIVSLNASIGILTIPLAAVCILALLAALTLLATTRHRTD
jgi:hypothetical protein